MNGRLLLYTICFVNFSGCVSTYFKTPNDVYKTRATVFLETGEERNGELTIQFETGFESDKFVTLSDKGTGKTEKIPIGNIKYYRVKDSYYVPRKVDLHLDGNYYFLFMKRLTPASPKIELYELDERFKTTNTGENEELYFISLPTSTKYEVVSIYSKKLLPDFEHKMSDIVADCPALATKIKSKEKGYYIPNSPRAFFPDAKRLEVYRRIIEEYIGCP